MPNIQPIETYYRGYHFRSRLEARWAVFFDRVQIKYRYEDQGFEYADRPGAAPVRYLPDFWLPDLNVFAEVKGVLTADDLNRMTWMQDNGSMGMDRDSFGHDPRACRDGVGGIILLGQVPEVSLGGTIPMHAILQMHKGPVASVGHFAPNATYSHTTFRTDAKGMDLTPLDRDLDLLLNPRCTVAPTSVYYLDGTHTRVPALTSDLAAAYQAARAARFEHTAAVR